MSRTDREEKSYIPLNKDRKNKDGKPKPIAASFWDWSGISLKCIDVKTVPYKDVIIFVPHRMNCAPPEFIQLFVSTYCHLLGTGNMICDPILCSILKYPEVPLDEILRIIDEKSRHMITIPNYDVVTSYVGPENRLRNWEIGATSSVPINVATMNPPITTGMTIPGSHNDHTDWDTLEEINRLCFDLREARKASKNYLRLQVGTEYRNGQYEELRRQEFEVRKRWIRMGLKKIPGIQNCWFDPSLWILYDQKVQNGVIILLGIMRRNKICRDMKFLILRMIWISE
ncbi:MAG: hypothetical protein WCI55_12215 [Armatimonadota bacterium]